MHALLPFFVNGTLDPAQRQRVERWIARSPSHAQELDWLLQLARAVRSQADEARADAGLDHLRRLIAAEAGAASESATSHVGVRRPAAPLNSLDRWTQWFKALWPPPRALAYGIVVLQTAALVFFTTRPVPEEKALPRSTETSSYMLAGPYARVIFAPSASEADIRQLLLSRGLQIVGGPNLLGEYWLARSAHTGTEPQAVLSSLQKDPLVRDVVLDDKAPTSRH